MGEKKVKKIDITNENSFIRSLLNDIKALEIMLENDMIESGKCRMGAEQEVCFINSTYRPASIVMDFLDKANDDHYTTELAKFNMEINLDPIRLGSGCFTQLENELRNRIKKAEDVISEENYKILLTGILPTIRHSDLVLDNITPVERYRALDDALKKLRGESFEFRIAGIDELITRNDSVMFESCNTSYQVHIQVDPHNFATKYNWAQLIAAPLLACSTNSPLLFGKRLWRETRIALFQQSIDVRNTASSLRDQLPRVSFGNDWIKNSIVEIYRDDIARHRVLLEIETREDALKTLSEGKIPKLNALKIHNGSIYRWNRACYGVYKNQPHIRIENRVLPSGPSIADETANSAFWLGMMNGMPEYYEGLADKLEFDDAKDNFIRAARQGIGAQFSWINNNTYTAQTLILEELLPIAKRGLEAATVSEKEITKYLGIIEQRVQTGRTGSQWILDSFTKLKKESSKEEAIIALTSSMYIRQQENKPVHEWAIAELDEAGELVHRFSEVEDIMTKDLITVSEDNPVDLVVNIMDWRKIRHVPVENRDGEFTGIVTAGILLHYFASKTPNTPSALISEIMERNVYTVPPNAKTENVLNYMKVHNLSAVPIVNDKRVVGIVTEHDFLKILKRLYKEVQ